MVESTDKAWRRLGQIDPYFAVVSHEQFRTESLNASARKQFFEMGEVHVAQIVEIIRRHIDSNFAPNNVLDYGCGVGRIVIPLARRFPRVVGVDISEGMINEAARNCAMYGVRNVDLISVKELDGKNEKFDFIHSFIVFQHIRPKRGEKIALHLINRLTDGGVGALHFVFARNANMLRKLWQKARARVPLLHNLANVIQGRPLRDPLMEMNAYDINRLLLFLYAAGCHSVYVRYSNHGGHIGAMLFFRKDASKTLTLS